MIHGSELITMEGKVIRIERRDKESLSKFQIEYVEGNRMFTYLTLPELVELATALQDVIKQLEADE